LGNKQITFFEELEQLHKLHVEVRAAKYELGRLASSRNTANDVVRGSRHVIPYDVHNIHITGHGSKAYLKQKAKYENQLGAIQLKIERLESKIDAIEDAEIKAIVRLYYVQNLTWKNIAKTLWPKEHRNESYPRQKVKAWFRNCG
jgi:DNA-directed RNA polymerase specialized sigma subunit